MITMTEIAKMTNVSQPTVSRVLNGSSTVSPDIRERVLACARQHNYQFNALAKGLQGRKTMLLGLLVTDVANGFFADLAKAVEAQAKRRGYSILLFNSDYDPEREREYLDVLSRYRVDGAIAVPVRPEDRDWPHRARRLGVPLVMVTRRVAGLDCVYLDHEEASGQVARHLLSQGCGRFLFVGGAQDAKYAGFRRELLSLNRFSLVSSMECRDGGQLRADLAGYLRAPGPKPGLFAHNDICALRVLRALGELGVSVPEDAGLVGFDDTDMGRYLSPALTSVSQPLEEMAEQAVARLLRRMDSPDLPPLDRPLRASLVIRESSVKNGTRPAARPLPQLS